jgi:hypothetical protein
MTQYYRRVKLVDGESAEQVNLLAVHPLRWRYGEAPEVEPECGLVALPYLESNAAKLVQGLIDAAYQVGYLNGQHQLASAQAAIKEQDERKSELIAFIEALQAAVRETTA